LSVGGSDTRVERVGGAERVGGHRAGRARRACRGRL